MQKRRASFIEQCFNVGSGFVISLLTWVFVITPLWGLSMNMLDNLGVVLIFTVISICRGYFWRRMFTAGWVGRWLSDDV